MLPMPRNYAIWPGVVPADQPTEMVIAPCEKAFLLFEGEEYRVTVISVDADEYDYSTPTVHRSLTATAHEGVLRFRYTFPSEQEHTIILEKGEAKLQEFTIYSLHEDLYGLRPMKGDFHGHSFRSDGRRDPSALAGHYREQGYDFLSLTDHNRFYPGGEIDETFAGVRTGIRRIPGEEVHTPDSVVHIVHIGGKSSVTEMYLKDREGYERAVDGYMKKIPTHIPQQYHRRYAMAMWATDRIHEVGGLAIFPHPFWRPGKSRVYNVTSEFARILLTSGMFDAYELIGGMGQPGNNRSVALWADLRAEGLKIPVVGSSDVHGLEKASTFPHLFTVCLAKSADPADIIDAVRAGNTVAVETTGDEYARHYRCYGSMRLVSYAQFLLQNYFPLQQRVCQGEGIALRAYAMGDAPTELIELQAVQAENLRERFFGLSGAPLPSQQVRAFEKKWRAVHLQGPYTKGSSVNYPPVTRQI